MESPPSMATEAHVSAPAAPGPWGELDHRHLWHPFAQMRDYLALPPLAIASGKGGWLFDTEGRAYLDGNASIWTNVHGHGDPDLDEALRRQLGRVAHSTLLGLTHPPAAELAAELAGLAPEGLGRVFYSDNGAGAVEVALKLSFQYWQLTGRPGKRGVVGLEGGYHGDTFGAMAAGDSGAFHERFRPWCFASRHFPAPACLEWNGRLRSAEAEASLRALRQILEAEADRTACVILEPSVQGAAGMRLQPPGFVSAVAGLCREHGVHLILDEVFVGFGRLGPMLVCAEEGVAPDFLCLAKGLTAGYLPLAATLAREEIFEAFLGTAESRRAFYHGHTFTGNPLAAAVALENIRKLRPLIEEGVLRRRIQAFGAALEEAFSGHPAVAEIRQRGFAAAIDLRPGAKERPAPAALACLKAREHGLILRPLGNSLLLVPPLCLSEEELGELARRTLRALDDAFESDPSLP